MDNLDILGNDPMPMDPCDDADLRIAETDHRVANSLSLTAAMLRMQRQQSDDATLKTALRCAESRVMSIAKFHTYLHRHNRDGRVDLANAFSEVVPALSSSIGVRCLLSICPAKNLDVSKGLAQKVMIIANELALNALKHGYGGREGGCISAELSRSNGNCLSLTVTDSGVGLPEEFCLETCKGLGVRIISSLVMELGGTISYRSEDGAQFTVTLPLD